MGFQKGYIPWNKGKTSWNKGISCPKETRLKISEANKGKISWNKGKHLSKEVKLKISLANKNNHFSPNTEFKKGIIPWCKDKKCPQISAGLKGKKRSLESREKQSKSQQGIKRGPHKIETRIKIGEAQIKDKNHNWKGGITKLNRQIRNSLEYSKWRLAIFTRDRFACQNCHQIGNYLEAHHIIPFALILKENNLKNFDEALICKELWDINNGITLCEECHKQTESYLKNEIKVN